MSSPHQRPLLLALFAAATVLGGVAARPDAATPEAPGKKHPRLVSASAKCATCHAKLFEGKTMVHAATEDCTGCHRVDVSPAGTKLELVEAEPGLCLTCHDGLGAAAKGELAAPHPPVIESCLTCHEPHASDRSKLLRGAQAEVCSGCHDAASLAAKHGNQLTAATACSACHAPHGGSQPKLLAGSRQHAPFVDRTCDACHREPFGDRVRLRARGQKLCLACHDDPAAAATQGGSTHPALVDDAKGRASCLACHQPHLSDQPALLLQPAAALCARCHPAIAAQAKAKTGHPPAAEDCTTCHVAHAGPQPRLLNAPRAELCAGCHDPADATLRAKHLGADLAALDCLACHSPHGEGNAKLLARQVHAPLLDGCDTCHQGAFDKLAEGGGSPLCLACHGDVQESAAKAAVPHAALEMGPCTQCHNPHAAAQAKLVKAPGGRECTACHAEQAAGDSEVAHGVIALLGCEACHEPHGGSQPKLLRRGGTELCLACHGPNAARPAAGAATVQLLDHFEVRAAEAEAIARIGLSADGLRNHPTTGHRTLGTPTEEEKKRASANFTGELGCLACHDPHKGKSAGLFRWNAASASEACQHCHAK